MSLIWEPNQDDLAFMDLVGAGDVKVVIRHGAHKRGIAFPTQRRIDVYPDSCGTEVQCRLTLVHEVAHILSPSEWTGRCWRHHGAAWQQTYERLARHAIDLGMFPAQYQSAVMDRACGGKAKTPNIAPEDPNVPAQPIFTVGQRVTFTAKGVVHSGTIVARLPKNYKVSEDGTTNVWRMGAGWITAL